MSVSPADLCSHGDQLEQQQEEVAKRSAISRHYYAAYHRACQFEAALPARGADPAGGTGTHARLIHRLKHPHASCSRGDRIKSPRLAAQLKTLRFRRTFADYDVLVHLDPHEAAQQRAEAAQFLRYCDAP